MTFHPLINGSAFNSTEETVAWLKRPRELVLINDHNSAGGHQPVGRIAHLLLRYADGVD